MSNRESWTALGARTTRMLAERATGIVHALPESIGSCQVTVTGALNQVFRGEAGFAGAGRGEGSGIFLHLADRSGAAAIDLIHLGPLLPMGVAPVGDLQAGQQGPEEWFALYSTSDGEELSEVFFAVSGEVRLHPLADGHLGGQFAFKARSGPTDGSATRLVTVAGFFCARQSRERLPLTAGCLSWDWDLAGLGLEEADLDFN
jgi:hypothetical protein